MADLIVKLKSPEGHFFDLKYRLFDNPFVNKWQRYFREIKSPHQSILDNGIFYGPDFYTEEEIRTGLIEVVAKINSYKKNWIKLTPHQNMSQKFLSALHDEFERIDNLIHYDNPGWPELKDFPTSIYFNLKRLKNLASLGPGGIRDLVVPHEIADAVTKLNTLIHRYESLSSTPNFGHVDVLINPVIRRDFEPEDYKYFSTDDVFGYAYLAYGVTGVPVLNAFENQATSLPVPQSNYTAGLKLSFGGYKFDKMNELRSWLQNQFGWNADDPKMALGYIPLGELQSDLSKSELFAIMKKHRHVHSVDVFESQENVHKNLQPALWPTTTDLQYHLKFRPWIQLPVQFDHEACYREAAALLDKFVVHRDYDQSSETQGKWKSLGINALNGDSTKTLNYPQYGVTEPQYSLTEVARLCPQTISFLQSVTDLSECQRVRFMLLEPGARISPHSDSMTKDMTDTSIAINIALNMPEGCDFWTCLNTDGTHNQYTQKMPMTDGSFFIFNNSQYHSVVNNSDKPRIHIIIHGPIRFSTEEVLRHAQQQNNLFTRKAVLNQIIKKFSLLGIALRPGHPIYTDWLAAGHDGNLAAPEASLAILADNIPDRELNEEAIHNLTSASLFPENPPVIATDKTDIWLKEQLQAGHEFAVLIGAGTYVPSANLFMAELFRTLSDLRRYKATAAGHLIHRSGEELPFFHEQFLIIDLKRWRELGCPSLDEPYTGSADEFPKHHRSIQNVHDDYTPLWMTAGSSEGSVEVPNRTGKTGWGTRLMKEAIHKGHLIINLPNSLRETKKFSYPRAGRDWQYQEIKKDVESFLKREVENVFVVNNEPLKVFVPEGFKPDHLITVSAGLKPAALVHQFWRDTDPAQINVIDISKPALNYMQELVQSETPEQTRATLKKWFAKTKSDSTAHTLSEDYFKVILADVFENDFALMLNAFKKLRKAHFAEGNIIANPEMVSGFLKPGLKTYFWHSNAFTSNASLFLKSRQQLRESYQRLALNSARTLKSSAWVHRHEHCYEAYVGDGPVQAVFSTGYTGQALSKAEFVQLIN